VPFATTVNQISAALLKATAPRCRLAGSAFAALGQWACRLCCTTHLVQQCIPGIKDMARMCTCLRFAHHSPFPCAPGLPGRELDISIQAQIINLFLQLQRDLHLTRLFISHDLSVVRHVSDRVAIMYLGRIVEIEATEQIFAAPRHPYTRALLESAPRLAADGMPAQDIRPIRGELPSPINPPSNGAFHQRCRFAQDR